jgi:aclacinomycin oxidase
MIGPDDLRYRDLVERGFNKRFTPAPEYVRLVGSTADVVAAVQDAVDAGLRLAVRSGGHCLEGFLGDLSIRVLIDTSLMSEVYFDPDMNAFAVEAGATLGEVYRKLYLGWGVTIPAGESPAVGVGGHIAGGAFGFICRRHGLAVDHLYAVEVVIVDADGTARSVVATREPNDPNFDLWWAHTGGGAGNFGVLTRCWFRSPDTRGDDPESLLPRAPASVLVFRVEWKWDDIDQGTFAALTHNYGEWAECNADAALPSADLFSILLLGRRAMGKVELKGLSIANADTEHIVDEHVAAIVRGVRAPYARSQERMSWLAFATNPFPELFTTPPGGVHTKVKDAFLRRRFSDRQIAIAYDYLTRTDYDIVGGVFAMATYGGQVNVVDPAATATAQRESILDTAINAGWLDPREAEKHLAWTRAFYRDMFADTGGVPVPGNITNGSIINHPDTDFADPAWNTSGVPWSTLYYKDNYPRLQRIKARFDSRDVFRHALSVRPG